MGKMQYLTQNLIVLVIDCYLIIPLFFNIILREKLEDYGSSYLCNKYLHNRLSSHHQGHQEQGELLSRLLSTMKHKGKHIKISLPFEKKYEKYPLLWLLTFSDSGKSSIYKK